jgi:hypothetical protein
MHKNCLLVLTEVQFSTEMIYPCIFVSRSKPKHSIIPEAIGFTFGNDTCTQDIRMALNRGGGAGEPGGAGGAGH